MIEKLCLKIEQNKYCKFLKILIACGSFLFVCFFISFKAHASGVGLPYVPKTTNYYLTEEEYNLIRSVILETDSSVDIDNENVIIFKSSEGGWFDYGTNTDLLLYNVYVLDGISCYSSWSNNSDFTNFVLFDSNYYLDVTLNDCYYFGLTRRDIGNKGDGKWSVNNYRTNNLHKQFYGDSSSIHIQNSKFDFTYLPYYPIYCNVDFYTSDTLQTVDVFLGVGSDSSVVTGSSVAPTFGAGAGTGGSDFLGSGADFGGSVASATMPSSPIYNTYNFTTYNPPSFDNSSVLDALSSIYDILIYTCHYLVINIVGAITTLGDNIQTAIDYIGDLIKYGLRTIITNIQNGIQNLFENIQSLFEPLLNSINVLIDGISQKLDYISQPFDSSVIQDTFENTGLHDDIDSISQFTSTAFGIFDSTSEPNDFKIPLHLENIPLLNISQVQYIDLGCINSVKSLIRAVMWCLTTFSLLYTVIDAIPSYISGGDE